MNVLPEQDRGNRLFLDGGGLGVALLLDGAEQLGREAEIRELHACGYSCRCGHTPAGPPRASKALNDTQIGALPRLQGPWGKGFGGGESVIRDR